MTVPVTRNAGVAGYVGCCGHAGAHALTHEQVSCWHEQSEHERYGEYLHARQSYRLDLHVGGVDDYAAGLHVGYVEGGLLALLQQVEVELLLHGLAALDLDVFALGRGEGIDVGLGACGFAAQFGEAGVGGEQRLVERLGYVAAHGRKLVVDELERGVVGLGVALQLHALHDQVVVGGYCALYAGGHCRPVRGLGCNRCRSC